MICHVGMYTGMSICHVYRLVHEVSLFVFTLRSSKVVSLLEQWFVYTVIVRTCTAMVYACVYASSGFTFVFVVF
eukprot:c35664_g1_i1 orf=3-221(-)